MLTWFSLEQEEGKVVTRESKATVLDGDYAIFEYQNYSHDSLNEPDLLVEISKNLRFWEFSLLLGEGELIAGGYSV